MTNDESAEKKIAELERELLGTQEMLAFVLRAVGEPVVVTHEDLSNGIGSNYQIRIDEDVQKNLFVFSLVEVQ